MRVNNRGGVDTFEYSQMPTNMHTNEEHGFQVFGSGVYASQF